MLILQIFLFSLLSRRPPRSPSHMQPLINTRPASLPIHWLSFLPFHYARFTSILASFNLSDQLFPAWLSYSVCLYSKNMFLFFTFYSLLDLPLTSPFILHTVQACLLYTAITLLHSSISIHPMELTITPHIQLSSSLTQPHLSPSHPSHPSHSLPPIHIPPFLSTFPELTFSPYLSIPPLIFPLTGLLSLSLAHSHPFLALLPSFLFLCLPTPPPSPYLPSLFSPILHYFRPY